MRKITAIFILFLAIGLISASPTQNLERGVKSKDIRLTQEAVDQLVLENNLNSYNYLLNVATSLDNPTDSEVYFIIIKGFGQFANKDVISKMTDFILTNKDKSTAKDILGVGIRNNHSSVVVPLLKDILEKGEYFQKLEVIDQLGSVYTKDSLSVLFGCLKTLTPDNSQSSNLLAKIYIALRSITSIDHTNYTLWLEWWDKNKDNAASGIIKPKVTNTPANKVTDYRVFTGIELLPKEKIIVVKGDICEKNGSFSRNYDQIEKILEKLNIAYTLIGKSVLEGDDYSLDDKWALIFNCNLIRAHCCCPKCKAVGDNPLARLAESCAGCNAHIRCEPKLTAKCAKKIARFVENGGYLFTEDLQLEEIIGPAFPNIISLGKVLPAQTVKILPAPGSVLHPYMKSVFETPPALASPKSTPIKPSGTTISVKPAEFRSDALWQIDDGSLSIKVRKKAEVTILISSPTLAEECKDEGAVAVTFAVYNKTFVPTGVEKQTFQPGGRVLHVLSHFGKQRSAFDEFSMQNLLLNFLMELSQRRTSKD